MGKEIVYKIKVDASDLDRINNELKKLGKKPVKVVDIDNMKAAAAMSNEIEGSFTGIADTISGGAFSKMNAALKTSKTVMTGIALKGKEWIASIKGATVAETVLNGIRSIGLGIMAAINIASGGLLIAIGLVVTAVIGMVSYFTRGEEGANRLAVIWDGIKIVFDKILDATTSWAKLLFNVATFNWKGVAKHFNDIKDSLGGITDTLAKQNELSKERAQLDKDERKWLVEKAKLENKSADLRLKSRNEDEYTNEQRKAFLVEAMAVEDEIAARDMEIATTRYENLKAQNELATSSKQDKEDEAKAEAEVSRLETARLRTKRRMTNELVTINKKITTDAKKADKDQATRDAKAHKQTLADIEAEKQAKIDAYAAFREVLFSGQDTSESLQEATDAAKYINPDGSDLTNTQQDSKGEDEKSRLMAAADFKILNEELTAQEILLIEQQLANDLAKIDADKASRTLASEAESVRIAEAGTRAKLETANLYADGVSSILGAIADNQNEKTKEGFELSKKLRIAQATMAGVMGIMNIWADPSNSAPAYVKVAQSIALGAASIANIAKIRSTQFESGGGGGTVPKPRVDNAAPSVSAAQTAGAERQASPMKAFVVMSDLEAANTSNNNTKSATEF